jgi:hypothetical protein
MLTAADRLDDKTTGFELGADDYLGDAVPGLVQPLHPGAEAEPEASARHLADIEGGDGDDEGAAGERRRDPGRYPDCLGLRRKPGRLGDRAAQQLRSRYAVDPPASAASPCSAGSSAVIAVNPAERALSRRHRGRRQ